MDDINLNIVPQGYQQPGKDITLSVESTGDVQLEYKFLLGQGRNWETIKEFSKESKIIWKVDTPGEYSFMVQAKELDSNKPFDYSTMERYNIKARELPLMIKCFEVDKDKLKVGEKIKVWAQSNREDAVYKFLANENGRSVTLKDIGPKGEIEYHFTTPGMKEIVMNCSTTKGAGKKSISLSKKIQVLEKDKPKIVSIKSEHTTKYVEKNIKFNVSVHTPADENILYKFMRVQEDGSMEVLRDYSSKNYINLAEKKPGKHILLCYIKDMFSINEYDDRAKMIYTVKEKEKCKIELLNPDVASPQKVGTEIKISAQCTGDHKRLYRYIITKHDDKVVYNCGGLKEKEIESGDRSKYKRGWNKPIIDTDYMGNDFFKWIPEESGMYKIKCLVKGEEDNYFHDSREIEFEIKEMTGIENRIVGVEFNKDISKILVKDRINVVVNTEYDFNCQYRFSVVRGNRTIHEADYSQENEIEFTPKAAGEYKLIIDVKGTKSSREYDSREIFKLNVMGFVPGVIDYILYDLRDYFLSDNINFEIVGSALAGPLYKYNVYCDGILIEESEYDKSNIVDFKFKREGRFKFEFFTKNPQSDKDFDHIKSIEVDVKKGKPIIWSKLEVDGEVPKRYEEICFKGSCNLERDIIYEFYISHEEEWSILQRYSTKNFFSYIPKKEGEYKVLMLVKHIGNKDAYEHYCVRKFIVNNG